MILGLLPITPQPIYRWSPITEMGKYSMAAIMACQWLILLIAKCSYCPLAARTSSFGEGISRRPVLRRASTYRSMVEKVFTLGILNVFYSWPRSAFAASVWANDVFLGTSFGKWVQAVVMTAHIFRPLHFQSSTNNRNIVEETDDKFILPPEALRAGEDNVITVVQVELASPILRHLRLIYSRITWGWTRHKGVGRSEELRDYIADSKPFIRKYW